MAALNFFADANRPGAVDRESCVTSSDVEFEGSGLLGVKGTERAILLDVEEDVDIVEDAVGW